MFSRGSRWAIGLVALLTAVGILAVADVIKANAGMYAFVGFCFLIAFVCFAPRAFPLANRVLAGICCLLCLAMAVSYVLQIAGLGHGVGHASLKGVWFFAVVGLAAGYFAFKGQHPEWSPLIKGFSRVKATQGNWPPVAMLNRVPAATNQFDRMLQACHFALGAPPRKLGDTEYLLHNPPAWLKKSRRDPLWEVFKYQSTLYEQGVLVWGYIVQANSLLFKPGLTDSPASIIYSTDTWFDDKPEVLGAIAKELYPVKGNPHQDLEMAEFSRLLADELDRALPLAARISVTDGRAVFHTSVMVPRKHLPQGYLTNSLFPLLIQPAATAASIIVPSRYWPDALVDTWEPDV